MFLELVHISVRGEQKDLVKKKSHFRFDCSSADHQLPIIRPICFLHKLASVKSFKADVSRGMTSVIPSDEGLTLKKSALKLFTVANLHYQLN